MMDQLLSLDTRLFRWINREQANPFFDQVMPWFDGDALLIPIALVAAALLVWKGKIRGTVCLFMLLLVTAIGDGFVCRTIKEAVGRPRPYAALTEVRTPKIFGTSGEKEALEASQAPPKPPGKSAFRAMPSSHAANWFAAAMVMLIYFRRSAWFMFPFAALVSYSRVYNGAHYPGDVLAGAILGMGYAAAILVVAESLWRRWFRRVFPLWWDRFPSLLTPRLVRPTEEETEDDFLDRRAQAAAGVAVEVPHVSVDAHWLRLGYLVIFLALVGRLLYLASDTIQLSEDEAYQWHWSKHLALSYFSKPPLIAYAQFAGTSLWGDTAFGIRFLSPMVAAVMSFILLRFYAREVNARAAFALLLVAGATPLLSAGSVLMTVDPWNVLFWTAAMIAGWKAAQDKGTTRDWAWVGVWMGFGLLSKYTQLFQLLCWAVFFALWPPARKHLRRPGPWLALAINLVFAAPVLLWNASHDWITVSHVADNAGAGTPWRPTLKFFFEFLGAEAGLLNPVFFVGMTWAAIAFWRTGRKNPRALYFFSMGAPVFIIYLLWTFKSRVFPNWIAPSVIPLFCLMVLYWDTRWRLGARHVGRWFATGLAVGFPLVLLAHDTNIVEKIAGTRLPGHLDPLRRVRGWEDTARVVDEARRGMGTNATFIIGDHYGITSQISFYLPESRAVVSTAPFVYCKRTDRPVNQFYFWPGYENRTGQDAVFVRELSLRNPNPKPAPERIRAEFESVTDLGVQTVTYRGTPIRRLQLYACRNLLASPANP